MSLLGIFKTAFLGIPYIHPDKRSRQEREYQEPLDFNPGTDVYVAGRGFVEADEYYDEVRSFPEWAEKFIQENGLDAWRDYCDKEKRDV